MRHLYEPDDEIEARALEGLLRQAGLRVSIRAFEDTAYPGITDKHRAWGEIRVHPEDFEEAQHLVADWLESEVAETDDSAEGSPPTDATPQGSTPPSSAWRALLPWGLLALSLLTNWAQWRQHRPDLGPVDTFDAEGHRSATFVYREDVDFPSEYQGYNGGRLTQRCVDAEPNGRFERCTSMLSHSRRLVDADDDENGFFEASTLKEAGETLSRWNDEDDDGLFDHFVDQHGNEGRDTDGDGMPNIWECGARSVDLRTCSLHSVE